MQTTMQKMMGLLDNPVLPAMIKRMGKEGAQDKGWFKAAMKMAGMETFGKSFAFQRMLDVIAGMAMWPTSVPIYAQVNELIPHLCEVPFDYLYRDDPEAMAECTLLVWEYLGLDVITLNLDAYNFEAEAIGALLTYYTDHAPDIDRRDFLIKGRGDLGKVQWGGIQSGRYPYLVKYAEAFSRRAGFQPPLGFSAPWTLACNLYGTENLIVDTMADPDFVHELLERIVEDLEIPMLRDVCDAIPGLLIVSFADAMASPPMVSADIVAEFVVPYYLRVEDALRKMLPNVIANNSGIWGSSCLKGKDKDRFIDSTIQMAGQLFVFDPDIENDTPRYYVEYADEHGVPLLMGMSQNVLEQGSMDTVMARAKEYTLEGKRCRKPFTFFFSNISPQTPIENIKAAVQTVRVYGKPESTASTPCEIADYPTFKEFLKRKQMDNPDGYDFDWLTRSKIG